MNADDIKYVQAEEGRYGLATYENDDIMNEGCAVIVIDEMSCHMKLSLTCTMSGNTPCSWCDTEPVTTAVDDKPPAKKVASDPCFGDYETPEDAKTRGGENYHLNKQKAKPHSPKSERVKQREKRVKDIRIKESRCHKKAVVASCL